MKYSDIMRLTSGRAAYNIQQEGEGDWETFIANDTFNKILGDMTGAVAGNDVNKHKSVWVYGTYGTGKSHAGVVLKHLFCDPADEIRRYVDREFGAPKFNSLREDLYRVREQKRLLPVSLYGAQSIAHPEDLALQLQKQTVEALHKAGVCVSAPTDFDTLARHIDERPQIWQSILDGSPALRSVAPTLVKLKLLLADADSDALARVRDAQRSAGIDVRLRGDKIYQWIGEVQEELRKMGTYCGLLFVWDEFTEVAASSVGLPVLHKMQELVEALSRPENDTLFLLIAHPSALNGLNDSERKKTTDRYHYEHYNMEPVSAFKMMSRKFEVSDNDVYDAARRGFFAKSGAVVDALAQSALDPAATADDIRRLFPLHPSTANLATYYAREAGSSSRSVFDFLASREVADFLEADGNLEAGRTITCDYLWDYVRKGFEADTVRFGAVVERWNSHHVNVEAKGDDYARVFKGILLLNALNNIANSDSVTPGRQNIEALFVGTEVEGALPVVLDFFNDSSIIQRQPNGSFSILYTALPADEIVTQKEIMTRETFPNVGKVINHGETAKVMFGKHLGAVLRPLKFAFFSRQANENTFQNMVENAQRCDAKGYELFVAILVGRDSAEVAELRSMAERSSAATGRLFGNTIFAVMDAPLGDVEYGRFVEYMANAACAQSHGLPNQVQTYDKNARDMIAEWCKKMLRLNVSFYLRGKCLPTSGGQMVRTINEEVAPTIFSKGPESLDAIRAGAATYWKMTTAKTTVDNVLRLSTKQDIVAKCVGQAKHVDLLLQDSVDDDLSWKEGVSASHPLRLVADYVDEMLSARHTDRNKQFNLAEKLRGLAAAPYGLFRSYAPMAMVAFAMRRHVGKLYDVNGKPCDAMRMVDVVVELFNAWDGGDAPPRLEFSMEGREARSLCNRLVAMFSLDKQSGYSDVSTLKDARWAVRNGYVAKVGVPLWALKYCASGSASERMKTLTTRLSRLSPTPIASAIRL